MPACEPLDPVLLRRRLEDVTLWTDLSWTPTTGSTNADLAALAAIRALLAPGTQPVVERQIERDVGSLLRPHLIDQIAETLHLREPMSDPTQSN